MVVVVKRLKSCRTLQVGDEPLFARGLPLLPGGGGQLLQRVSQHRVQQDRTTSSCSRLSLIMLSTVYITYLLFLWSANCVPGGVSCSGGPRCLGRGDPEVDGDLRGRGVLQGQLRRLGLRDAAHTEVAGRQRQAASFNLQVHVLHVVPIFFNHTLMRRRPQACRIFAASPFTLPSGGATST